MSSLQYVGLSHFREISKADFSANGIEHGAVKFSRTGLLRTENPNKIKNVVEVSQEVADFLLEVEPTDWKVVEGQEADTGAKSASTPPASPGGRP